MKCIIKLKDSKRHKSTTN